MRAAPPSLFDAAVGDRLRRRRRSLGLSHAQLAETLGITAEQVWRYEQATTRIPAPMLVRAAARLRTTAAALVGDDGPAPVDALVRAQLAVPGAVELLRAFAAIRQGQSRGILLTAARASMRRAKSAAQRGADLSLVHPSIAADVAPGALDAGVAVTRLPASSPPAARSR